MKINSRLGVVFFGLLPVAVLLFAACTTTTEVQGTGDVDNTLSIDGRGEVVGEPDVVILSIGVSVLRDSVEAARDEAARTMDAVLQSLRDNGVQNEEITTTQLSVFPEFDSRELGESQLRGFRVLNQVAAKIREVAGAGEIIDDAVSAGGDAVIINGVSFTIDDPTPLLAQARELAVSDAQAKAQTLADLAGVTLGRVISISESGGVTRPVSAFGGDFARAEQLAVPSPISHGQLSVTMSVFLTFELE